MMRSRLRERRGDTEAFNTVPAYNSLETQEPEEVLTLAKRKSKAALKALAKQLLANRKLLNVAYPSERKLLPRLY